MLSRGASSLTRAGARARLFGVAPKGSAAAARLLSIDCGDRCDERGRGGREPQYPELQRSALGGSQASRGLGALQIFRKWQPQHVLRLPPATRAAFYSSSAFSREKDGKDSKDDASSSSPRLEARFGKVGKFFDSLGDEVSKELGKNEEIKSGLSEMIKQAEDLRKSTLGDKEKLDNVVDKEKIDKAREKAGEAAAKASEEAKKRAEDLSKAAGEATERLSSTFDSMKQKVSETAGESEFARKAQEKAKNVRDSAASTAEEVAAKVDTSEKSIFGRFIGAVKETLEEAKEDFLGEAGRNTDGRRKVARRKRKAEEEGRRRVAQAFGMRGGRRMRRRRGGDSDGVPRFTEEQVSEAFAQVSDTAEDEEGRISLDQLGAALDVLGLSVSEEDLAEMVESMEEEGVETWLDLAKFQSAVGIYQEKLAAAASSEDGNVSGSEEDAEDDTDAMIDDPDWESAVDPESGDTYYYNVKTGDTTWDKPEQISVPRVELVSDSGAEEVEEQEFRDWKSPEEEARGKSRYGRDDEMIMVDEEESSWQRIKDRLTATPIIQDILGAGGETVRTFAKTDAGRKARKRLRKGRNKIEDLQEQWETSQNPYVFAVASAYDEMFAETPEGQAIKELRRLDNDFVLDEWLLDVEDEFAPLMLEAYITGDVKLMDGICADSCKAMVGAAIADRKQNGFTMDPTILDIRGANLMAARPLEKAPR